MEASAQVRRCSADQPLLVLPQRDGLPLRLEVIAAQLLCFHTSISRINCYTREAHS
jgi:hypothetical protein